MDHKPSQFTLPFLKREQLLENVYSFYFDTSKHPVNFKPGQYLRIVLPHDTPDERGTGRFFTIASSPLQTKHIIITTRLGPSTFKNSILQLSPGNVANFSGPYGTFVYEDTTAKPLLLLSGGMGITPFYSMVNYVVQRKLPQPITLIASFQTREECVYFEELIQLAHQHAHLTIVYTLTRQTDTKSWAGEQGRITRSLIEKYWNDMYISQVYICGPTAMVASTREIVASIGVSDDQIMIENFSGY